MVERRPEYLLRSAVSVRLLRLSVLCSFNLHIRSISYKQGMLPKNVTRNHRLVRLRIFPELQVPRAYLENAGTVGAADPRTIQPPPSEREIEQRLLHYYMRREGFKLPSEDTSVEWQPVVRKEVAAAALAASAATATTGGKDGKGGRK